MTWPGARPSSVGLHHGPGFLARAQHEPAAGTAGTAGLPGRGGRDALAEREREHVALVVVGVLAHQVGPARRPPDAVRRAAEARCEQLGGSVYWLARLPGALKAARSLVAPSSLLSPLAAGALRLAHRGGAGPGELPGVGGHVVQVPAGVPAELGLDPVGRGDQHRRVASPARRRVGADRDAGDLGAHVDDLADREAGPVTEVVDPVLAGPARGQRPQMSVGQVGDVDVVADAGPVRGGVVVAEDLHPLPGRRRGQHGGDQVGLRVVPLAEPGAVAGPVRAGHVEVAQADRGEPVEPGELGQRGVHGQLGRAVGVGRAGGVGLGDRRVLRLAVDRGGGGEHDGAHADLAHRLQQRHAAAQVA